jgi:serine/threonine protein kinase
MREATSSDGSRVVLKLVDDDMDELAILKHLNQIISEKNHTIELHGIVEVKAPTVIALRWRIPLDDYFNVHNPPESAASFPEQFLEGVAFLHEHKVAHLDLKPGNVVVDGVDRERPPRLVIIDFGLSVFVENERTTIKGFRGTPQWVAPEVGTRDGPDLTYSPVLADRWACGKMMFYLGTLLPGSGDGSRHRVQERLRDQLTNDDPESRPSLEEVVGAHRKGVKRIAEGEESVEMQKRQCRFVCYHLHFSISNLFTALSPYELCLAPVSQVDWGDLLPLSLQHCLLTAFSRCSTTRV